MMICVFATSYLVLEDLSSFLCVETSRPVRQTPSSELVRLCIDAGSELRAVEDAESEEVGAVW